ncbi:hypothetical protein [Pelagibaculum spongiae]|uniref:FCP1 homology domain-containing protein n=1 Tax=Pelagibaculum spongiae TaxID=2080658 RepID=A0A2V1GZT2_9GAMM|nr:hypothetical protein [Pelagibaculum spongiae]PVZ71713.1 hypothetical protein DC094_01415 [Pelagibaculum spongiae]
MWHIFFDLDLTLIVRKDIAQALSEAQRKHLSPQTSNLTAGFARGDKEGDVVFSPLYQDLHQQLFLALADSNSNFHFVTAGSYLEIPTRFALKAFFSNGNGLVRRSIENAPFINRAALDKLIGNDLDSYDKKSEDFEQILIPALASAKTDYMKRVFMEQSIDNCQKMILVDDSECNRFYASHYNFQIIDPTKTNYGIILRTLTNAISSDGEFYSFHNHDTNKQPPVAALGN